jgi:hypothetical protein
MDGLKAVPFTALRLARVNPCPDTNLIRSTMRPGSVRDQHSLPKKKQIPPLGLKSSVGMTITKRVASAQLKLRPFIVTPGPSFSANYEAQPSYRTVWTA